MHKLIRIFAFFYPPLGLLSIRGKLEGEPENYRNKIDELLGSLSADCSQEVFNWSKFIHESESNRKKDIESKAQSYLVGISLSITLLAAIRLLFNDQWLLPYRIELIIAIFLTLAIVFMLTAAYYAVRTRRVGATNLPSADLFLEPLEHNGLNHYLMSASLITYAKKNEKSLIEKSNSLYLSEACFIRAIVAIFVAFLLVLVAEASDPYTHREMPLKQTVEKLQAEIDRDHRREEILSQHLILLDEENKRLEQRIDNLQLTILSNGS